MTRHAGSTPNLSLDNVESPNSDFIVIRNNHRCTPIVPELGCKLDNRIYKSKSSIAAQTGLIPNDSHNIRSG